MIAAIYARKSTEQSGVADEHKSVARQVDHARGYAARKGWTVVDDHIYVDDGISGAEFERRKVFMRLMSVLKRRAPFDVLIVSELSRLGREQLETGYAVKQLAQAGVRIVAYLDDREVALDSPVDKFMLAAMAFGADMEREKHRQRQTDTMTRKAKAGHVTGGRVFGYDPVDVMPDGQRVVRHDRRRRHPDAVYVGQAINAEEAAVVRLIFERAAAGDGLKTLTKHLNAVGALTPRTPQGRARSWAPSSVREVLHRELYAGRRVWNKTRKRDAWGRQRQQDRPRSEWVTVEVEDLRIVPDALWRAAHTTITARAAAYDRYRRGEPGGAADGRGVRQRYLLTGFSRCDVCGGSMQVMSRASTTGRRFRYCCATYWNCGSSVCGNGRMVAMPDADAAVAEVLRQQVLQPARVERALLRAVGLLQKADATLEALTRKDAERRALVAERDAVADRAPAPVRLDAAAMKGALRRLLAEWDALLQENRAQARPLLQCVLAGRIAFKPPTPDAARNVYTLVVPIAFDRILTAAVPAVGRLQDKVSSPTGFEPVFWP